MVTHKSGSKELEDDATNAPVAWFAMHSEEPGRLVDFEHPAGELATLAGHDDRPVGQCR